LTGNYKLLVLSRNQYVAAAPPGWKLGSFRKTKRIEPRP